MIGFRTKVTRQVEFNGDTIAVTLDRHGVTMRPKGARNGEVYRSWQWLYRHILEHEAQALRPKPARPVSRNLLKGR